MNLLVKGETRQLFFRLRWRRSLELLGEVQRIEPGSKRLAAHHGLAETLGTRHSPGLDEIETILFDHQSGIFHQLGDVVIEQKMSSEVRFGAAKTQPSFDNNSKLTEAGSHGVEESGILLRGAGHQLPAAGDYF